MSIFDVKVSIVQIGLHFILHIHTHTLVIENKAKREKKDNNKYTGMDICQMNGK